MHVRVHWRRFIIIFLFIGALCLPLASSELAPYGSNTTETDTNTQYRRLSACVPHPPGEICTAKANITDNTLSILAVGIPRSGSTALYNILRLILQLRDPSAMTGWQIHGLKRWKEERVPVLTKTHKIFPAYTNEEFQEFNQIYLSHRNFRSAMYSYFKMFGPGKGLSLYSSVNRACHCKLFPPTTPPPHKQAELEVRRAQNRGGGDGRGGQIPDKVLLRHGKHQQHQKQQPNPWTSGNADTNTNTNTNMNAGGTSRGGSSGVGGLGAAGALGLGLSYTTRDEDLDYEGAVAGVQCSWYSRECTQMRDHHASFMSRGCNVMKGFQMNTYWIGEEKIAYDIDYELMKPDKLPGLVKEIGRRMGFCLQACEISVILNQLKQLRGVSPPLDIGLGAVQHPLTILREGHITSSAATATTMTENESAAGGGEKEGGKGGEIEGKENLSGLAMAPPDLAAYDPARHEVNAIQNYVVDTAFELLVREVLLRNARCKAWANNDCHYITDRRQEADFRTRMASGELGGQPVLAANRYSVNSGYINVGKD